jgi:hypothetical protein
MTTTTKYMTPQEIASIGFETLVKNLGPGAALQFMLQYERGRGDYTKERSRILKGVTLERMRRSLLPKKA